MPSLVQLTDLCKHYEPAPGVVTPVLKSVSLTIDRGEFVAIMGTSGSGKTTLMNILGTLDRASSGEYLLEGDNVTKLNDSALADFRNKRIGFVFQGFNLLPRRTLEENVALPLFYAGMEREERLTRAKYYLEMVGLGHRLGFLPTQLSGGQQQRVAIARALAAEPSIILADEPTGNLDSHTSDEIMTLFGDLHKQGITLILVTHEQDIAQHAERLVQVKDGEVIYDGPMY